MRTLLLPTVRCSRELSQLKRFLSKAVCGALALVASWRSLVSHLTTLQAAAVRAWAVGQASSGAWLQMSSPQAASLLVSGQNLIITYTSITDGDSGKPDTLHCVKDAT